MPEKCQLGRYGYQGISEENGDNTESQRDIEAAKIYVGGLRHGLDDDVVVEIEVFLIIGGICRRHGLECGDADEGDADGKEEDEFLPCRHVVFQKRKASD